MNKNALIVLWNGNAIPMKPTFDRGCEITRVFASRGGREINNRGMTLAYPHDVTKEALLRAKEEIEHKLASMEVAAPKADDWTRETFLDYLEESLIPDLIESGSEATAQDFRTAIKFLSQQP